MSSKKDKEEKVQKKRSIPPEEERAKRGRWITIVIFILTLVFGYVTWKK